MSKMDVLVQFAGLLRRERKFWLAPVVLMFVLFGLILVFSESSALAPLIYAVF